MKPALGVAQLSQTKLQSPKIPAPVTKWPRGSPSEEGAAWGQSLKLLRKFGGYVGNSNVYKDRDYLFLHPDNRRNKTPFQVLRDMYSVDSRMILLP